MKTTANSVFIKNKNKGKKKEKQKQKLLFFKK